MELIKLKPTREGREVGRDQKWEDLLCGRGV